MCRKSHAPDLPEGTYVSGFMLWQRYQVLPASGLTKISQDLIASLGRMPLSIFLGAMGMTGMTA